MTHFTSVGSATRGRPKHKQHEDEELGKIFVGGLSWDTTVESLHSYFSQYGDISDCVVMKNNETGRSRGFGFVTYTDPEKIEAVMSNCPHILDGRTIDPKPCNKRSEQQLKNKTLNYPKVFLGGLPANITETDLRTFFSRYGEVMEVVIMYDQEKKKSRGFGFLSFKTEEMVDKCVVEHYVNIQNKQVEIKRAEPRNNNQTPTNGPVVDQWGQPPTGGPHQAGLAAPPPMQHQMDGWGAQPTHPPGPPAAVAYPPHSYGTSPAPATASPWGPPPAQSQQTAPLPQWGGGAPAAPAYNSTPQHGQPAGYGGSYAHPPQAPQQPGYAANAGYWPGAVHAPQAPPVTQAAASGAAGDLYGFAPSSTPQHPLAPTTHHPAVAQAAPMAQTQPPKPEYGLYQQPAAAHQVYPSYSQPQTQPEYNSAMRGYQPPKAPASGVQSHYAAPVPDFATYNANPTAYQPDNPAGGPGPQRAVYNTGPAAQSYHPYRR